MTILPPWNDLLLNNNDNNQDLLDYIEMWTTGEFPDIFRRFMDTRSNAILMFEQHYLTILTEIFIHVLTFTCLINLLKFDKIVSLRKIFDILGIELRDTKFDIVKKRTTGYKCPIANYTYYAEIHFQILWLFDRICILNTRKMYLVAHIQIAIKCIKAKTN